MIRLFDNSLLDDHLLKLTINVLFKDLNLWIWRISLTISSRESLVNLKPSNKIALNVSMHTSRFFIMISGTFRKIIFISRSFDSFCSIFKVWWFNFRSCWANFWSWSIKPKTNLQKVKRLEKSKKNRRFCFSALVCYPRFLGGVWLRLLGNRHRHYFQRHAAFFESEHVSALKTKIKLKFRYT